MDIMGHDQWMKIDMSSNNMQSVNVIIEIAANSGPVKYEFDKKTRMMMVDRMLSTAMHYPCNYGFVPDTLCDDGDPADVLVVTPYPLYPGVSIMARPVGMLEMEDEKGVDHKIIAVPTSDITSMYDHVQKPSDLSQVLLDQIVHFFEHYKDLEPGKWVKIKEWLDADAAHQELKASFEAYA